VYSRHSGVHDPTIRKYTSDVLLASNSQPVQLHGNTGYVVVDVIQQRLRETEV
jgi:hypothetical protein